jgi:spore coat polysaccharide biosynthesis protein SpsF
MTGATVAVIQARMGSTRLPGKVLMPVAGRPLLWHIIHRATRCRRVDRVMVATSDDAGDDPLAAFCREQGTLCIRGPLLNVLERYRMAAEATGAGTLVRITGDAALIDPGLIDAMLGALAREDGDFVRMKEGALCAHEGADAFSRRALDWLTMHAANDSVAREHVTSWFKLNPAPIKTVWLDEYPPLAFPPARLSVDTPEDLEFLRAVHDRLGVAAGEARLRDVLLLLEKEPELRGINAHVRQKPATETQN